MYVYCLILHVPFPNKEPATTSVWIAETIAHESTCQLLVLQQFYNELSYTGPLLIFFSDF